MMHEEYEERRLRALQAYRRRGSFRKAAAELGLGVRRTHELVHEGLRIEMARARKNDERIPA